MRRVSDLVLDFNVIQFSFFVAMMGGSPMEFIAGLRQPLHEGIEDTQIIPIGRMIPIEDNRTLCVLQRFGEATETKESDGEVGVRVRDVLASSGDGGVALYHEAEELDCPLIVPQLEEAHPSIVKHRRMVHRWIGVHYRTQLSERLRVIAI